MSANSLSRSVKPEKPLRPPSLSRPVDTARTLVLYSPISISSIDAFHLKSWREKLYRVRNRTRKHQRHSSSSQSIAWLSLAVRLRSLDRSQEPTGKPQGSEAFGHLLLGIPGIDAGEIDVLPAERREVLEQFVGNISACRPSSAASPSSAGIVPSSGRKDHAIATVMAGIRNRHAAPPRQKEAILPEDLIAMLETLDRRSLRGCETGRCC